MPRRTTGSVYSAAGGYGIRWPENGQRPHQAGFKTKTEARQWFAENVAPRLKRRGPSADITFEAFCVEYLDRWGVDVSGRTRSTVEEWLAPARERFGRWTLGELEGAANDVSRWRSKLPTEHARYKHTRALRQVLEAAKRWGYIAHNPAAEAGSNPQPRGEEIQPFAPEEVDAIVAELAPRDAGIVLFAAETGLRTNEWTACERRDVDRHNPAIAIARRFAEGVLTPYPKTSRRRVPLTPRALAGLDMLPARLDTPILFAGEQGGHLNLNNWRNRIWYPALEAAGIERRGPYELRHTFATEALAAGVSIFRLSRLMGTSVEIIDRHYGHLVRDDEDHVRELLAARSGDVVATADGGGR
ncbi:MAG: tyrosine-type recombinase/integrase [Solirubrobacteraceae bacterium]